VGQTEKGKGLRGKASEKGEGAPCVQQRVVSQKREAPEVKTYPTRNRKKVDKGGRGTAEKGPSRKKSPCVWGGGLKQPRKKKVVKKGSR